MCPVARTFVLDIRSRETLDPGDDHVAHAEDSVSDAQDHGSGHLGDLPQRAREGGCNSGPITIADSRVVYSSCSEGGRQGAHVLGGFLLRDLLRRLGGIPPALRVDCSNPGTAAGANGGVPWDCLDPASWAVEWIEGETTACTPTPKACPFLSSSHAHVVMVQNPR